MSARREERVCAIAEAYALENYHLVKERNLGAGAFGSVFLAIEKRTDGPDRKHAVKICVKPLENSDVVVRYLEREVEIHKTLKHRNIVELYNGQSLPDCTILDMEYCERCLTDFVKNEYSGVLPENIFRIVARHVTSGIKYMHGKGIVHRDLKSDNVLMRIMPDGSFIAKLADFGFAKNENLKTALGTPVYIAPEVHTDQQYTDRCDLWSLGIMYYKLVTGVFPFRSRGAKSIVREITDEAFVGFDVPDDVKVSMSLKHFVKNHLVRDPNNRFSAVEAMNHPFLLPSIRVLKLMNPLANFTTQFASDVEAGDIAFERACSELGGKINDFHSLQTLSAEKLAVTWEDVAKRMNIDGRAMNDLCIVSNGGMFPVKDVVQHDAEVGEQDSITALFISADNGIRMNPVRVVTRPSVSEDDIRQIQAIDKSSLDALNAYLVMWNKYFKNCSTLIKARNSLYTNCVDVEFFRATVVNCKVFDSVFSRINAMQQELKKKCDDFPMVAIIQPKIDLSHDIDFDPADSSVIPVIRRQLKDNRAEAQKKADSQNMDVTQEVSAVARIWDENKGLESRYQKDVSVASNMLRIAMESLRPEAEVFSRLFRYMRVLEKAMKDDDPRAVCPELKSLADCDYLSLSTESKSSVSSFDRDKYLATLRAEIEQLEKMNEEQRKERQKLEQQRKALIERAGQIIERRRANVEALRQELARRGIPDPTMMMDEEVDEDEKKALQED